MGYEYWPDALEACLRYAAGRVRVPIYITETGIATGDDARRIDFIRQSLRECSAACGTASTFAGMSTGP